MKLIQTFIIDTSQVSQSNIKEHSKKHFYMVWWFKLDKFLI